MQILQNVLHSLTKRKKQAGKVTVTAAVAAVFIAVIVVSANGILSYQKAVTKKTFGGWFIMENSSNGTQSEELKTHPYLAGSGKAVNTAVYSVSELSSTEIKIGYMDSMAAQLASLTLLKGAMPQNNDEIAVERHTLETLGYSEELGQTITVSYPDKNNKTSIYEKQLAVREYTLTGVLEDYAAYWDSGSYMPVMLVTQIEAENYAQTESVTTLYALNEDIHTADYRQIYQGMYKVSTADTKLIYNSKTYDSHETDFGKMSIYAGCFALAAGIFVTAAVLWTYQRERRTAYRQFERMGMTCFCRAWYQLTELCVLIVPAAVVGTAAGIGIVWLILWILLQRQNAQAQLTLTAFGSVAAWTAVFCVITALWGLYAAQRVDREKQKQKKKLSVWTMRYGQHVIKAGFTGIVVLAVLVCTQKMSAVQKAYTHEKRQPDLMITPDGIIDEGNSDTASESSGTTSSETVLDGEKVMMDYKYDTGKMRVIHGLPQSLTAYIGQMSGIDKTDTALVQNWMVLYYKTKNDTEFYKQYIEENGLENFLNKGVMKYEMPAYSGTRTMTHFVFSKFNGTRSLDYYVAANRAVYEELEDYIDEEYRDYEAFERGEQAVLVIQKGAAGEYVDTCKAGDTLSSSSDYFYWMNNNHSSYAVSELYQECADYMQKMRFSTAEFDAVEEILSDMDDKQEDEIRQEIQELPETLQEKILYRYRAGKNIYKSENPVTVAAVVYLDEENETAFYEKFPILKEMNAQEYWIMPESVVYNRYQLSAKRMCTVMEKEYDPEQYRDLGQNVMTVSYGLSALYQATDEVLRAYLDSYGYSYASHFEENNVYRIQYLNQLFFYGITIAGILLLYGLILVVWSLFYLQEQKKRIRLLMELGMERSAIYTDEMQNCSLATVPGAVMAGILFYAAGTVQGGPALGSLQTAGIAAAVAGTGLLLTALIYVRIGKSSLTGADKWNRIQK